MEKPWYASFEREPVASVKVIPLVVVLSLGGVSSVFAESTLPASIATETAQSDQALLRLPAFDTEWNSVPQSQTSNKTAIKVGDELDLKIVGIQLPGIQNPTKELSLSSSTLSILEDEGWVLGSKVENAEGVPPTELRFHATPLRTGKLVLPSLVLKNSSGVAVGRTNPFAVEVVSAIKPSDPKPEEPAGLEPPVSLQFPWWIIALFSLLGLIALGAAGYALYRWQKNKKGIPKKIEPPKSEDELALSKLADLEKQEFLKRGNFKAHYFKVSEILKAYVGARYRFDAPESTTREMISILEEKMATNASMIDRLEMIFNRMDRVKFTDFVPPTDESSRLIAEAREFIVSTRRPQIALSATEGSTGVEQHASR